MILLAITACIEAAPPAVANEGPAPSSILDWLPATNWSCAAIAQLWSTSIRVDHHWAFAADTYTTDLPNVLETEANAGRRTYADTSMFQSWVAFSADRWQVRTGGKGRWSAVGEDVVFLELTGPDDTDGGGGYVTRFRRYEATDGVEHLLISGIDVVHVIDCVRD